MGEIGLAVRSLLKAKVFTAVAVVTMVIGIGITTAVYTVYHAVVLRPLPFHDQDRLVDVEEWSATELCAGCAVGVSRPTLTDLAAGFRSMQSLAAYLELPVNVGGSDAPERVSGARVSGNFFAVLGLRPVHGRALDAGDDRIGAPPVVVLSERLFQRRFGGDASLVGRTIRLNGRPTTVVGVMPATAVLPEFAQLWMPLDDAGVATDRTARDLGVIGRLRDGVTIESADLEVKTLADRIAAEHPDTQKGWTGRVRSLRTALAGEEQDLYAVLLGAGVVLWAIVCANLAGLLLARGVARRKEIAVRLALGARRRAVIWHLLAESLCIAVVGGALGAVAASWTIDLLLASMDTQIPHWMQPRMDGAILFFCIAISLVSAAAFGLWPALRATRLEVQEDLKSGSVANIGGARSSIRGSLVVLQLSLSLVLLAASGVLAKAMDRIATRRQANDDHDVVQARFEFLAGERPDQITAKVSSFVDRFASLPEARSAAATATGFIAGFGGNDVGIRAEGVAEVPAGVSPRFFFAVTPRYFETVRMPIVKGRQFTSADAGGTIPVAIINERIAGRLWPGQEALGHRIRFGSADSLPWRTIVGLVSDMGDTLSRVAYVPFAQAPLTTTTVLVGAKGEPSTLFAPMRTAARTVDADMPLLDLMTVAEAHRRNYWPYQVQAIIMSAFGAVALALASIGLYGVVAYGAEQRTREIGVRIALGAKRLDVIRLVTRQGLRLVSIGVIFGIAAASLALPIMRSLLFGASPFNVMVFATSAGILVAVALVASYVPALRASRVDPMVALRSE